MKTTFTALSVAILLLCGLRSSAQGFAIGRVNTFLNYGILSENFDRTYVGIGSEIGYEFETATYQLEAGFYFPRQADTIDDAESPLGYYGPAAIDESSTVLSLALMGRYYLFSLYTDVFRPYTNSGILFLFEHANRDIDSGFETWNESFTNKNLCVTAGLGFELTLDNDLSPFFEVMGHFPLADFESAGTTIYDIPYGVGIKVSGGMKFYLGGY